MNFASMRQPVRSELFAWMHADWPNQPYPMVVDHLDVPDGRVCPAASLYAHGRMWSERMKAAGVEAGSSVKAAAFTWLEWLGILQACLRRGASFWVDAPGSAGLAEVAADFVCTGQDVVPLEAGRRPKRNAEITIFVEGDYVTETELMAKMAAWNPQIEARQPVWIEPDAIGQDLAVLVFLKGQAELHLGASQAQAAESAEPDHLWFRSQDAIASFASMGLTKGTP